VVRVEILKTGDLELRIVSSVREDVKRGLEREEEE
jgi:hypothetical protein